MRTQVGIIGGGPSGLMLSHLCHLRGIETVVLEDRSREYVERRVRAGVLEHDTVQLLVDAGVGERCRREGLIHHGIELRFDGKGHRIDLSGLTGGRTITVYGQQEVVKDLADRRIADGGTIFYEASDVELADLDSDRPVVRFSDGSQQVSLECDFVAGCDGFHGVSRAAMPEDKLRIYDWTYPFAWLGILATVPPSTEELIYARHERGFALHSLRSPELSRLYLQVDPFDEIENWPDDRIWSELATRFATEGWELHEGPIIERGITPMRSFVTEPMALGRLYLAGDAAHIVPPTGAKGLNLAIHDVQILADALATFYATGREDELSQYSQRCLQRVWRVQHFSWWMTSMLHRFDNEASSYRDQLQLAELSYVVGSRAASTTLAENYVGLPDAQLYHSSDLARR